jgi:hypothetical protein
MRYKISHLLCFLFLVKISFAQEKTGLAGLIHAEKAFAALAFETNTRQGFLEFLDSTGVVFNEGKAQNGLQVWTANPVSKSKLLWHPVFAGIAASGDLGFTTGPWIFRRSAENDTVLASGFYTTIWHLTKDRKWKFLADMGIQCEEGLYKINEVKEWAGRDTKNNKNDNVLSVEKNFISSYDTKGNAAFSEVIDQDSWFNVDGSTPFKNGAEISSKALSIIPGALKFIPVKGEMASSADFGYVYGFVRHNGKDGNYLRVWKNTGNGFKILLQVLSW